MGRYESRFCNDSGSFGVWDTRAGVWEMAPQEPNPDRSQEDADALNEAGDLFILEVGR